MSVGIIVAGHCSFGTGILSALELIAGKCDRCYPIDFPKGMSVDALREAFDRALKAFGDHETIVLVDLFGGSPFNVAMSLAMENSRVHVVYGVNLAMLLELSVRLGDIEDIDEMMVGLDKVGRDAIGFFSPADLPEYDEGCAETEGEGDCL